MQCAALGRLRAHSEGIEIDRLGSAWDRGYPPNGGYRRSTKPRKMTDWTVAMLERLWAILLIQIALRQERTVFGISSQSSSLGKRCLKERHVIGRGQLPFSTPIMVIQPRN